MNQPKMKSDKVHSHILVNALADTNRLRRFGASLGGLLFGALCVLLPAPAEAQCPQWDVSGEWKMEQSDGITVYVTLRQSGKTVTGTANYVYTKEPTGLLAPFKGTDAVVGKGPVSGNIAGDDFAAEIRWSSKSVGIYRGKVGSQGRIEGTVYDQYASRTKMTWFSPDLMKCQEKMKTETAAAVPCRQGEVWRERFDGDTVCVPPDQRWVMEDGSCRQGWVKLGVGPKKDTCGTPEMKAKAEADAAKAQAAAAKDKLQSGNPQDFAGTWNTTRRGETLILTLRVDGTNATGEFTNPSRPTSNGTLTGTIKTYEGNFGPIVKLKYVTTQPTAGDGSFDVFADGRLEGGFTWQEPGKAKKTFIRWNGTRASN